jgi:hypothetical protein
MLRPHTYVASSTYARSRRVSFVAPATIAMTKKTRMMIYCPNCRRTVFIATFAPRLRKGDWIKLRCRRRLGRVRQKQCMLDVWKQVLTPDQREELGLRRERGVMMNTHVY